MSQFYFIHRIWHPWKHNPCYGAVARVAFFILSKQIWCISKSHLKYFGHLEVILFLILRGNSICFLRTKASLSTKTDHKTYIQVLWMQRHPRPAHHQLHQWEPTHHQILGHSVFFFFWNRLPATRDNWKEKTHKLIFLEEIILYSWEIINFGDKVIFFGGHILTFCAICIHKLLLWS